MTMTSNKVKSFWAIFFGIIAVLATALAVWFNVFYQAEIKRIAATTVGDENFYKMTLENKYQQSVYQLTDSVKNIEVNLGKACATSDVGAQTEILAKTSALANSAVADLSYLPVADGKATYDVNRYCNQVSDFCLSLCRKTVDGEALSTGDKAALTNLKHVASSFLDGLKEAVASDSGMFVTGSLFSDGANVLDDFMTKTDPIFQYEKLIYDGPFSDSIEKDKIRVGKALTDDELTKKVAELFDGATPTIVGRIKSEKAVEFSVETDERNYGVAMLADGRLLRLDACGNGSACEKQRAIDVAQEFCARADLDVKAIWVSREESDLTYVNLAPIVDGVVVYPDIVKVSVDANGVVGLDAKAYRINHDKQRDFAFDNFDEQAARDKVQLTSINAVNKAYVIKNGKGLTCYEVSGTFGEDSYFVYLDKNTLKQVEIFRVVQGTEGYTVI